jgi:mono/diheme cytochrome c family protein
MNRHPAWLVTAILGGLAGCSAGTTTTSKAAVYAPAADTGARIYSGNCIACHQQNGQGIPGVYPSLIGSPVVLGDPQQLALWVIKGQRPSHMPAGRFSTVMPVFGWMKAEDAAALLTYLRSKFGNSATPVDAGVVAQVLGE